MSRPSRKPTLEQVSIENQASKSAGERSKFVHMPGSPLDVPVNNLMKCRGKVPFACSRCMYPLHVLQSHVLGKNKHTPVMCLGTCYDAIKGNNNALVELGLESRENLYNVFTIPDVILADALGIDLEKKKENSSNATGNLDEGTLVPESPEEATVLAEHGLSQHVPALVRDGEPVV